ncbi:1872_t:CDS:2 [Ambispora gerdemannii]|uniref:1872_t:CDS:1 n=1 Tax=Ambispora gerdemannii TaxID=144530 RepID=A0A9N8YYR2_9GLOM|nr:1872_t:CDS:2 [Ambispora gerdemannii]
MTIEYFLSSLCEDFSRLLECSDDYNVKIKVGQEPDYRVFDAHSVILRARSSYFRAALSKDWAKSEGDKLVLLKPNISPKIFEVALRFIYTGGLAWDTLKSAEDLLDLLVAADEMGLTELLSRVETHLLYQRSEWLKKNFVLVHRTVFKTESFRNLQQFCLEKISHDPQNTLRTILIPGSKPTIGPFLPSRGEIQSTLINIQHASIISSWIDRRDPLHYYTPADSPYKFTTLLRGTRDGFSPKIFRERCNNQGSTVVVLKIHGKPQLIGGYNPIHWGYTDKGWVNTTQSFLFSLGDGINLAHLTLSRVQNAECAIWENHYRGPKFGYLDLVMGLSGHSFNEPGSCQCQRRQYEKSIVDSLELFHADEYEVFQVISKG